MSVKHKVLKDFQLVTSDKKIITLKAKTIIEDFTFKNKGETVVVEKEIIDNNQDYFSFIDWKEELNTHLKQNKIPQPAIVTKKLVPFIESMFINKTQETKEIIKEVKVENTLNEDLIKKELELDSKIRKNSVTEDYLESQLKSLNEKEGKLEIKEKDLKILEIKLNEKSEELKNLEESIQERINLIDEKESNINNYIEKSKLTQVIQSLKDKGFDVSLFESAFNRL